MRGLSVLPVLASLAAAMPAIDFKLHSRDDSSVVARPGSVSDMIISEKTTLNGTHTGPAKTVGPNKFANTIPLPLSFVNNFGSDVRAYLVGKCPNNEVCFIRGDGSVVYPSSGGSATPVPVDSSTVDIAVTAGQTLNLNLPNPINSARIYFAAGDLTFAMVATDIGDGLVQPAPSNPSDPSANVNWGFVELNVDAGGTIYANVSYVDFVGMVLGMQLEDNNGPTQTTKGLTAGAADKVCADLRTQQGVDNFPWGSQCMTDTNGAVVRVLSPIDYAGLSDAFSTYWSSYIDQVYTKFQSTPLNMKTSCNSDGNQITCANDEIPYGKPTANDIWGCNSGPFANTGSDTHKANLAILCAAFHRSTLLLDGGADQPAGVASSAYYSVDPTNHYSKSIHTYEVDGRGYAFPYDDVSVGSDNTSGTVSSANPKSLLIWIGGSS